MGQFFSLDLKDRQIIAANGDELALGAHTLQFIFAPNTSFIIPFI